MKKIVHVINLSTVGGVERLFPLLLKDQVSKTKDQHHLLLERSSIHPHIQKTVLEHIASKKSLRSFGILPVPRLFRDLFKTWIFKNLKGSHLIFWNIMIKKKLIKTLLDSGGTYSYYDHGSSWMNPVNEETLYFLTHAKNILTCSRSSRRVLELKWGVKEDKLKTVLNPLGTTLKPKISLLKSLKKGSPIHLGMAGRLHPVKGGCLVLQSLKVLKERGIPFKLSVAGDGPEREKLKKLTYSLGLTADVTFLGLLSDMSSLYQEIDLLLSPAIREPFGLTSIEAALWGCPVIGGSIDGFPEAISHEKSGLCLKPTLKLEEYERLGGTLTKLPEFVYDPESDQLVSPKLIDPVHLAEAVERLMRESDLFSRMSESAIQHAEQFHLSHYLEKMDQFFKSVPC